MDREKVIKHFEHLLNAAKSNYQDFVDLTADAGEEILALLKEQEDLGTELTNAVELIHKKNERIEKLLKEQEAKPLRCKECSYHRDDGWCNEHRREVKESDYCSFGAWEGR